MKRILLLTMAAATVLGGSVVVATPAQAASDVTVKKISTRTAPYGGKVTIKPSVTARKNVKVSSTRITVSTAGRVVARNKSSVKLAAGTHSVTTTVKYKTYTTKKVTKRQVKNKVTVEAYDTVAVTCVANSVDRDENGALSGIDATCTSSVFDGSVRVVDNDALGGDDWFTATSARGDDLEGDVSPVEGRTFRAELTPAVDLKKKTTVTTTTKVKTWSKTKTAKRTQSVVVKAGKRPSRTSSTSSGECPSWAPIKGNADSGIYHMPSGRYYSRTYAEECFATESAAKKAGYRRSMY